MAATELFSTSLFASANLQAYYRLEDASDSKNANTLTNNGSVTFTAAQFNNGANLGSSNSSKSLEIASNLSYGGGSYSLSAWVKLLAEITSGTYCFVIVQDSATDTQIYIAYSYNAGNPTLYFGRNRFGVGGEDKSVTYAISLGTSQIYHLAVTYNGTTVEGFVNGVSVGTIGSTGNGSVGIVDRAKIGASDDGSGGEAAYASALIDDVAFFNKQLSSTEVLHIFNGDFSPSISPSASRSPSASASPSISPSASVSPSSSASRSLSPSSSISASISPSASRSPSSSVSASTSPSSSRSPSGSMSSSVSPSPSAGYLVYSRTSILNLSTDTSDLATIYDDDDETAVAVRDTQRVEQAGTLMYMIHQFKAFVSDKTYATVIAVQKSSLDPKYSTVYLQIYNWITHTWVTIDSNNTSHALVDFELRATINDLSPYKDSSRVVSCRVYQLAI